jgi:transcriptional regulator GlxA family with amidase domain
MDLAGAAQVFYEASQLGTTQYKIVYCGVAEKTLSEQGLVFSALHLFHTITLGPGDFLFVPGVDSNKFREGKLNGTIKSVSGWLNKQRENGASIVSICSGALVLAEAGILNGRKCTTHWKCIDYLQKTYPAVQVLTDRIFVRDRELYSSAGMASGIDLTLSILETLHGPVLPAKIAREIVVYLRRNDTDNQETIYLDYRTHFNPAIHKVQDYIMSHPDKNISLEELAARVNLSVRTLTRLFKKATGHTIVEFKNAIKLELARTLIHNPDFTLEKIASLCGFQSTRHFRRILRKL